MIRLELHGPSPLDRLLEEGQRLVHASEARIRRSQGGRDERPQTGDRLGRLARQAELKDRDGAGEVSLEQARAPEAPLATTRL